MTNKDGGPAFPRPYSEDNGSINAYSQVGMTLRQYYAAKAMQTLIRLNFTQSTGRPERIAGEAFVFADAMIAEESK